MQWWTAGPHAWAIQRKWVMISLSEVDIIFFFVHFYYLIQLFHPHNRTLTVYHHISQVWSSHSSEWHIHTFYFFLNMLGFSGGRNCNCAACGHLILFSYIIYVNGVGMQSVGRWCRAMPPKKKIIIIAWKCSGWLRRDGTHNIRLCFFFFFFISLNWIKWNKTKTKRK